MDRPLDGIKVIDCSTAGAGPSCTKLLTEYGADTIWVEPVYGASTRSVFKYDFYCSGKRSLALDLKTNEGKKILDDLLVTADVFVSNYRTKALERLGLTYERLSTLNPRLIYAALTAYGDAGPDANKPGYDPVVFWARGGMLRDFAEKGQMLVPPVAAGDIISGQALAGGSARPCSNGPGRGWAARCSHPCWLRQPISITTPSSNHSMGRPIRKAGWLPGGLC